MNFIGNVFTFFSMATFCGMYGQEVLQKKAQPLSLAQSIVIGGLVGAAEVALPGQPLSYAMNVAIKNASRAQKNREPLVLAHSYRGFVANAVGQMPIAALQKAVQTKGSQWMEASQGAQLSDLQNVGVSFAAGVTGALIDTPSNAVQLYLQDSKNAGKNSVQALQQLGQKSFRGFVPNAFLKEGPFAVGYQMLAGKGRDVAQKYVENDLLATALGGAAAGVVTAVVTHPGAVIRNKMQHDPHAAVYTTSWQTVRKICHEQGVKSLFNGLAQRGLRVAVAVPLYVLYTNFLVQKVAESSGEKTS